MLVIPSTLCILTVCKQRSNHGQYCTVWHSPISFRLIPLFSVCCGLIRGFQSEWSSKCPIRALLAQA
ncbi:hypothetical protein SUGI_0577670 [Cryptomeria japonica]|nr:hypothetical protein SUGI_0577670 [Cryptomeria japonica]